MAAVTSCSYCPVGTFSSSVATSVCSPCAYAINSGAVNCPTPFQYAPTSECYFSFACCRMITICGLKHFCICICLFIVHSLLSNHIASVLLLHVVITMHTGTLEHRYSFNDGSARDSVNPLFDGSLQSGAYVSQGQLQLPTSGPYISIPSGALQFTPSGTFTLEIWFSTGTNRPLATLFGFGAMDVPDYPRANSIFVVQVPTGQLCLGMNTQKAYYVSRSRFSNAVNMYYVLVVSNGLPVASYLNGSYSNLTGFFSTPGVFDRVFYLGKSFLPSSVAPGLIGSIDELRITSGTMTSSQVQFNFASGPGQPVTMHCFYRGSVWRVTCGV